MDLLISFNQFIISEKLFSKGEKLLIAVSGGIDSVVLCELCKQSGFDFAMAHCNFQLRAEESDQDEAFVRELARRYDVGLHVKQFDTKGYAEERHVSIQVAARELRYGWFEELLLTAGNERDLLLTAHHADDNIETILMNFFKGSGINGLKGILPRQNHVVRPLLFATKEQIIAFCSQQQLLYREDSSNSSDKYTRNYFRNQLIPGIEKVFPQVRENLLHNAVRFRGINAIYNAAIEKMKQKLMLRKGNEWHLPVIRLTQTESVDTVLYEIIKGFGFTAHQTEAVKKLLYSESGKYVESASHRIFRNRKWLILAPLHNMEVSHVLISKEESTILFSSGALEVGKCEKPGKLENDVLVAQIDARNLCFPLLLRKWKKGDYFYPLGMSKKKKLSRFFTDQKMSLTQKENAWVLESNKQIVWVVGKRIDERFKLKESTTLSLRFRLRPSE